MLNKEDLDNLRERLPKGYLKILQQQCGKSRSLVSKVLNGERENDAILREAVRLAEEQELLRLEISMKVKAFRRDATAAVAILQ